eukprot:gene10405-12306_t
MDVSWGCGPFPRAGRCVTEEACTSESEQERVGVGAASAAALQEVLCNTAAYEYGVLCGGGTYPTCTDDYFVNGDTKCEPCPEPLTLIGTMIAVSVTLAVVIAIVTAAAVIFSRIRSVFRNLDWEAMGSKVHDGLLLIRSIFGILLGYGQVISRLPMVFTPENTPQLMTTLARYIGVLNLDVFKLLNIKCMMSHFYRQHMEDSELPQLVWQEFWQGVALPWQILLFVWFFGWLIMTYRRRQWAKRLEMFRPTAQHRHIVEYNLLMLSTAVGLFLL